jgi:hypothetical protein
MNEHEKKTWHIPADFGDRFPDGDYTVGRGADPRGRVQQQAAKPVPPRKAAVKLSKRRKPRKQTPTAAE